MNIGQERIRCGRKDRATLDHLSLRVCPPAPKARESKQLAVVYFEAVRLLGLSISLPLVKPICGDEATLRPKGFAERGSVGYGFGSSVDVPDARILRPGRHKSPAHH